jgi:hypothetical protein
MDFGGRGCRATRAVLVESKGETMVFISINRILPQQTVLCSLNVDMIIWFQDVEGKCQIMTVDEREVQCQDNSDKIRESIKDAGQAAHSSFGESLRLPVRFKSAMASNVA